MNKQKVKNMRKIDLHLHTRLSTEDKSVKVKNLFSSAPEMIAHMNYLGIEKAVLMSGGESNDFFGTNDEMCKICQTYPTRFAWMCNLDEKDIDTIHTRLEKYKQNGAIGIGELIINKKLDHPFLKVLFTAAEKLELPITIHMSPRENYNYGVVDEPGFPLLEQLLQNHPRLKILGHSKLFWNDIQGKIYELFSKYPNLYGDLSANSGGNAIMKNLDFGLRFLETFSDRLFFATDMLNNRTVYPLGAWLDEQYVSGKISRDVYEKLYYKNAERIFHL